MNIIIRGKHSEPNRRRLSQKDLDKNFGHLEDHKYRGYNRALGCMVNSKQHFVDLMEKGGFVPFNEGEKLAEEQRRRTRKDYNGIEDKTRRVISDLKSTAKVDGKLSSLEGTKRAMEDCGVNFNTLNKVPKYKVDADGFTEI